MPGVGFEPTRPEGQGGLSIPVSVRLTRPRPSDLLTSAGVVQLARLIRPDPASIRKSCAGNVRGRAEQSGVATRGVQHGTVWPFERKSMVCETRRVAPDLHWFDVPSVDEAPDEPGIYAWYVVPIAGEYALAEELSDGHDLAVARFGEFLSSHSRRLRHPDFRIQATGHLWAEWRARSLRPEVRDSARR